MDDRAVLDASLEVGRPSEQLTVTAEAPVLEESNGAIGQVVGHELIDSMPLDGHNPFTLMNLGAGVSYTGSLLYSRPFDNGAIADYSMSVAAFPAQTSSRSTAFPIMPTLAAATWPTCLRPKPRRNFECRAAPTTHRWAARPAA